MKVRIQPLFESGIRNPRTRNPESTVWNLESSLLNQESNHVWDVESRFQEKKKFALYFG